MSATGGPADDWVIDDFQIPGGQGAAAGDVWESSSALPKPAASASFDRGVSFATAGTQEAALDDDFTHHGSVAGLGLVDDVQDWDEEEASAEQRDVSTVVKLASTPVDQLPPSPPPAHKAPIRESLVRLLASAGRAGSGRFAGAKRSREGSALLLSQPTAAMSTSAAVPVIAPPLPEGGSSSGTIVRAPSNVFSSSLPNSPTASSQTGFPVSSSSAAAISASQTSSSGRARWEKPKRFMAQWSLEETRTFYDGLQQFGLNFSLVAQLFPNRSRQDIFSKYKIEEKRNPQLVRMACDAANQKPIDLDLLQAKQHERARANLMTGARALTEEEKMMISEMESHSHQHHHAAARSATTSSLQHHASSASSAVGSGGVVSALASRKTDDSHVAARTDSFDVSDAFDEPVVVSAGPSLSSAAAIPAALDGDVDFDVDALDDVPVAVRYAALGPASTGGVAAKQPSTGRQPSAKSKKKTSAVAGAMGSPQGSMSGMRGSGSDAVNEGALAVAPHEDEGDFGLGNVDHQGISDDFDI